MAKKPTLKTISNEIGVSVGTVSRILNGKAKEFRISDETVKLVLNYASEIGYTPNLLARGLRDSKTYTIGLMIPDIANPFFSMMAKNIEKAASEANYSILLVDAEENIEKEKQQLLNMLNRKVDGIIVAPVGTNFDHFKSSDKQNTPIVFVDRYSNNLNIPYITSNNFKGAYDATKLLINNGHNNIALIKGHESIEPVIERRKGYEKALQESGIKADKKFIKGSEFSIENGYKHALNLLTSSKKPTAIFAMSNLIGLGVLQAVRELGLSIPQNVSLIIFDDQPYVSYLNPPITTVKQNSKEIGQLAIDYLLKSIDDIEIPDPKVKIDPKIIIRESVNNITFV